MPRSRRIGSRFCASAVDTKSIGIPASRPRATSRPSCAASRSLRAILRAPLWVNLSGWPVSSVNDASFTTARRAVAGRGGGAAAGGGGAALTGEAGGGGRGLRGEPRAIEQRDSQTVPRQVIGDARAEGARANDHRVCTVDHRPGRLIGPSTSIAKRIEPLDDLALGRSTHQPVLLDAVLEEHQLRDRLHAE